MRKVYETGIVDCILGKVQLKVYSNAEWNEYIARYYVDNQLVKDADYFTDSKKDAIYTADFVLQHIADNYSKQ